MRVAAVATTFNEADIIGATLTHLYSEGVANVYIADASTDGTRDILSGFPCRVYIDSEDYHRQPYWIALLAQKAYEDGADWVIPFDADEFVYSPSGASIAEALATVDESIGKLTMQMFQHLDFNYREPQPKPLRKVAFRATSEVRIANGNHDATISGGTLDGVLAIREIQYRGFEHFCRKIVERNATIDPALPYSEGTHHKQYAGWTKEQLEPVWADMVARATVLDPIPVRR